MEVFFAQLVRYRLPVCIAFILISLFGIKALLSLPIDAFPDLTNNQVQILTEAPGMGPLEAEQLVTIPIESIMNGLPSVKQIRSISKYGLSVVTVVFPDKFGPYFPRQLVFERLQAALGRLPSGLEPQLGPISTALGEIYQYVVESPFRSPTELKTIHEWDIKYQLRTVPGIAEVNTWGGFTDEYVVKIIPAKLLAYGITLPEVFNALKQNNDNFGAGIINEESEQYIVRGLGRANTIADLENIIVKSVNGAPILIKNVATVGHGAALRQGAATKDGLGEVVVGLVMMLKGENSREVIGRVKEKITQIAATIPEGIALRPFYDQSKLVDQTIDTVKTNLLEGGLLVVLVLLLTVGNLRAALIVASAIPLSMMFSFIGMRWLGVTANIMSLGAVDFGMIVDGSIVMVENILRNIGGEKSSRFNRLEIIEGSVREVARPIFSGVLIITVVYIPILCLEGIEFKMFSPMVVTVCSALFGSLLISLILVPVLCGLFLGDKVKEKETIVIRILKKPYANLLSAALRHKALTVSIAVLALAASLTSLFFIGTEFVPKLDEGDLLLEVKDFPSISLPSSIETAGQIERIIKQLPEVKTVVSRIGRPDLATDPMGVYGTDCFIILKPKSEWRRGLTKEELTQQLRKALNQNIAGANFNFTQPIAMRVDELVSGVRSDVAAKIFGDDMDYLQKKASEVSNIISTVKGVTDLQVEKLTGAAQLEVVPDRTKMARYGVNVSEIRQLLQTAVIGTPVSEILQGRKRFTLRVQFPKGNITEPSDVGNLLIETADNKRVPLSQVAEIRTEQGWETVNRELGQRRIIVQCNVRNRDLGSFVKECREKIGKNVQLQSGYFIQWGGQFENQERAMKKFLFVVPLSIFIIFMLLLMTFTSVRQAILVILNVPFALIGGICALWIRGLYLSVPASIGFIALFGVAVLNGLVLVTYIDRLVAQGASIDEAVRNGAQARLRPVIMTALVAALGFLPMALSEGSGAEVQRPLATVVIGGLCTSTLLTLLVLPVVYDWVFARKQDKLSDRDLPKFSETS
jgi:cobalt-zinc-cadmium resistance protein CzcA